VDHADQQPLSVVNLKSPDFVATPIIDKHMEIKLATVRARIAIGTNSGDFAQNVPSIAMISQSIKSASLEKKQRV
jgi:hypothetical protein